jgi:2-keto-4-pentenoate hydratase/2-oxohepta-3-ene-1,7-dioic acid hydratase in catechol pathway
VKLMRIGPAGHERPAALADPDHFIDLSDIVADFDEDFFTSARLDSLAPVVAERVREGAAEPLAGQRIGAPVARPHQILCIGLNYSDHARETGQAIPAEPIIFNKAPNTLVGPDDEVHIPRGATKVDWEVELALVVAKRTAYLDSAEQAREHIAGWMISHDLSERHFQLERGGQWVKGKSAATFNPAGPYLVTRDEVPDVHDLRMSLSVNGVRRQEGSTSTMIFDPYAIVHYVSQFLVLEPGDIINTGTPPGVGMGHQPPIYLAAGDEVELAIEGLGRQRQRVVAAS